ncbi:MAG: hypothetical protein KDJ99_34285 [Candidatus Competibacteraceae bacterium]|nr:hypothetical protein [Candidatus Competibacteraceae bacterium]
MMQNLFLLIHDSLLSRKRTSLPYHNVRVDRSRGCHSATFHVRLFLVLLLLLPATIAHAGNRKPVHFDVAESGTKFSFDEAPIIEDGPTAGFPAYGNAFITQGYIYPYATLLNGNGVNPDGSPEFPELVIGEWTCRGYFIGDGANTATGPWVITTQLYDFYTEPGYEANKQSGAVNLVSEGYERADVGVLDKRSITGGTGPFKRARGEVNQALLGFNASGGVNLRFVVKTR